MAFDEARAAVVVAGFFAAGFFAAGFFAAGFFVPADAPVAAGFFADPDEAFPDGDTALVFPAFAGAFAEAVFFGATFLSAGFLVADCVGADLADLVVVDFDELGLVAAGFEVVALVADETPAGFFVAGVDFAEPEFFAEPLREEPDGFAVAGFFLAGCLADVDAEVFVARVFTEVEESFLLGCAVDSALGASDNPTRRFKAPRKPPDALGESFEPRAATAHLLHISGQ